MVNKETVFLFFVIKGDIVCLVKNCTLVESLIMVLVSMVKRAQISLTIILIKQDCIIKQ